MKYIGYLVVFIFSAIATVMWNGYVLQTCWNWFNDEVNLPEISFKFGMFTMIMSRYMTGHMSRVSDNRDKAEKLGESIAFAYILPAAILCICYLIKVYG